MHVVSFMACIVVLQIIFCSLVLFNEKNLLCYDDVVCRVSKHTGISICSLECPREGNSSDCSRNLGVKRFNAEPCGGNPKVLARGFSQGKVAHDALVDLEMLNSSGENNRKSVPSLQNGFFVQVRNNSVEIIQKLI